MKFPLISKISNKYYLKSAYQKILFKISTIKENVFLFLLWNSSNITQKIILQQQKQVIICIVCSALKVISSTNLATIMQFSLGKT